VAVSINQPILCGQTIHSDEKVSRFMEAKKPTGLKERLLHHRSTSGLSSDNRVRHSNSPSMTYLREKIHGAALVVGALSGFLGRTIQSTPISETQKSASENTFCYGVRPTRLDMVAGSDVDRRPGVRFSGGLVKPEGMLTPSSKCHITQVPDPWYPQSFGILKANFNLLIIPRGPKRICKP
jgi:hypothetical protein